MHLNCDGGDYAHDAAVYDLEIHVGNRVIRSETGPPWPWADAHPVARLRIPRLGYDEIVLHNASGRTLAFGPAVVLSGARVGGPGNLVLAGHRTSWFRKLEGIAEWDRIELEWYDRSQRKLRVRTYSVESISIVEPQDLRLLADDGQDALTLATCYPFGLGPRSPQRLLCALLWPILRESMTDAS